ncbi:MAG: 3-phosphoglycerate dehydrogenase [Verrucomicrobiales bacterium]|nr:3-phosphoglycerate dehydrogenase [Verrucomicrobiales bacterium]
MVRILLTTTSYQDTPGAHHALLEGQGYEIVRERGPLSEQRMLELAGQFDGFLCGDDEITRAVLAKSLPRLRVISKYGIGLDKIDLGACKELRLPVLFTPGVNHTTVAEHTFALMLALVRNLVDEVNFTRQGQWKRLTGNELWQKKIGIIGLGRIGQETVRRCHGFEMAIHAWGNYWPEAFCQSFGVVRHESVDSLVSSVDIVSLHTMLRDDTRHLINARRLALMPRGSLLINSSRGELVETGALLQALDSGHLGGYAADVMEIEPPPPDHPLLRHPKAIITPHIGSRTYESVPRQAMKATRNLIHFLNGEGEVFFAIGQ